MNSENGYNLVTRGIVDLLGDDTLKEKLNSGNPLNVKFGVDPTAPDIHLGHTVPLQKLRQFQQLGHNVILVIGDYTAKIGDPSGKSKTRPMLTDEQIKYNMQTYTDQVFKILDKKDTKLVYNSDWLAKFSLEDVLNLGSRSTIQQLLQRRDFSNRLKDGSPLTLTELMYPLLVGYDSVELAADVELGGTDQLFNFVASRDVQSAYGQVPEVVLTLPLLEGLDGVRKMSKSYGNTIGITDSPENMYGKVMSISDDLMVKYFELLSDIDNDKLAHVRGVVDTKVENPMIYKQQLARELVGRFHSAEGVEAAENYFNRTIRNKDYNNSLVDVSINYDSSLPNVVSHLIGRTKSDARRLIQQGGVRLGDSKITDVNYQLDREELELHIGKKSHYKVSFKD